MTTVAIHGFAPKEHGHFRTRTLVVGVYLLWVTILSTIIIQYRVELADAEFPALIYGQQDNL